MLSRSLDFGGLSGLSFLIAILGDSGGVRAALPNDPDLSLQWALINTGQTVQLQTGVAGADIDIVPAWAIHQGDAGTVVAIVGTGVSSHAEFADRLLEGRSMVGDPYDSRDAQGNGTHFAGIIAAAANNDLGIAGIAPRVQILPVRVVASASTTEALTANGIYWAVDHGASIILVPLALGTGSPTLGAAVNYAAYYDVLVIAPTGTGGNNELLFPAAFPPCLAVSATTNQDSLAPFSNYGDGVDLSAPGENIWSTLPGEGLGFRSFTASAAAHVAGVAALIRSVAPQLTRTEVRNILLASADDLSPPGLDASFGAGRLNAGRALGMTPWPPLRFELLEPLAADHAFESSILVRIVDGTEHLAPGSERAWYRTHDDEPFRAQMLTPGPDQTFAFELPVRACQRDLEFYFDALSESGSIVSTPWSAPERTFRTFVASFDEIFFDDFEADLDWTTTTEGSETAGAWIRVAPQAGSGQAGYDFSPDAGQRCFVTGQTPGLDVDHGPVILTSPPIEMPEGDVEVIYAAWVFSSGGPSPRDALTVFATVNGEMGWKLVDTVVSESLGTVQWREYRFRLRDHGLDGGGGTLQVRFQIADLGNDSFTEAAIDEVRVHRITCPSLAGDLDSDGVIDLADFGTFYSCFMGPASVNNPPLCRSSDLDQTATVDLRDLAELQNGFGSR